MTHVPAIDSSSTVTLRANAKLTRTLKMTGLRDDGYHLIDAEMVSLDLHDVITIEPGSASRIAVTGPFAHGVPTGASNLVHGALAMLGRSAGVTIDKQIPHGGGLGGGSTNAAAVLNWGGHGTDSEALVEAARLGADVSFCLVGGRARVTGIGEIIEPLPHVDREVTLIIPPLAVSTPAAYRAWDELGGPVADGPNDLEAAAFVVEPEMRRWRDRIAERLEEAPVLAGSGATWFTERSFASADERDNALGDLVDEGARIVVTHTTAVPFDVVTGSSM